MKTSRKTLTAVALAGVASLASARDADAVAAGPMFPPPNGVTFAGSGAASAASSPGRTFTFTNFSPLDLPDLYWGKSSTLPVQLAMDGSINSPGETMTLSSVIGNQARWSGATTIPQTSGPGIPALTRFTLTTATTPGGSPIPFTAPVLNDIPLAADAVVQVPGDFTAHLLFEASTNGGASWTAANDLYNATQFTPPIQGQVISSFGGGFYVVPEPASLSLLGLAGLAMVRRRR